MFNTYQELVDRINELLKERERQQKLIERLKNLYLKIPIYIINQLTREYILTGQEREYWIKLRLARNKEERNEKNN